MIKSFKIFVKEILLEIIPKSLISRFVGHLTNIHVPVAFRSWIYGKYAQFYGVKLEDAEFDSEKYKNFADFFTRNLKSGVRGISEKPLVSPVDALCVEQGVIENQKLIQAKGVFYTLEELFNHSKIRHKFSEGNPFWTFYLAPGDYHNIHAPCSGFISSYLYIPGQLFPVNNFSRFLIPNLYIKNERVITIIENESFQIAVIKVGAMNVGSIGLTYQENFRKEVLARRVKKNFLEYSERIPVEKGDKIGTFYLGSTVIVIANGVNNHSTIQLKDRKVLLGQGLLS